MTPPQIHVLAVDDEPDICALTKEFLELAGDLLVDTATSVVEAIRSVSRESYDVIISDYQMPDQDGIQLLRQLRASGNMTPFILFTGRGREEVVIEAIDNGAYAYIQKGGAPDALYTELVHKVRNAVVRERVERSLLSSADDLRAAASRYEALIAASNTGVWEYRFDSGQLWCSPEYFSMLGRDLHEYEGDGLLDVEKAWKPFLHPDDKEDAIRYFEEYLRQPQGMYQQYFRMLHKDGSWIWIWSRGKVLSSAHNSDRVMVGSHIDVSERRNIEDTLVDSEDRYRGLVENAPMAVFVNRNDKVVLVNQACLRLFGAKAPEQLLGRSIYEMLHPDYHDLVRARIRELRGEGKAIPPAEGKIIRLDGGLVDVEIASVPFRDRGGISIHVVLTDITARKNAEACARSDHLKMAVAMELTSMAHWEQDMGTGLFTFDDRFYSLYGTNAEREGGYLMRPERYVKEFVHPEDVPLVNEVLGANSSLTDPLRFTEVEHRIVRRDGEVRHLLIRIGAIVEDGRVVKLYGANQDISERRRTEAALRESEEKFHMLADMLPEAIYEADRRGKFTYLNERARQAFGLTQEDIDTGLHVIDCIMPEDRARAGANVQRIMHGEHLGPGEYAARRRDGTSFTALISSAPVKHQGGPVGMRGMLIDISGSKRVERALKEANKKLNLLSSITRHDISNQVLGLEGSLLLLKKRHPEVAQDDLLRSAERSARRISSIIQFTKSYEDIGVQAPLWQDVRGLVEAGARDVPPGRLAVIDDVPAGMEVFADPLIEKVFHNLVDNAVRHAEGASHIRFSVEAPAGRPVIVCQDDGCGIGRDQKEQLFTRGFGKNHGLGLFLSREILSITGITMDEDGVPRKGARFTMTVPELALRRT